MRTFAARRVVVAIFLLSPLLSPRLSLAGGIGVSEPPDSIMTDTTATSGTTSTIDVPFHLYKAQPNRSPRGRRDFDFLWSDTYESRFHMPLDSVSGPEQINDLQRLAETASEIISNPFGLPWTDIQIAYNFLAQQENYRAADYIADNDAPIGFRVAQQSYVDAERNHFDTYVYARSFEAFGQWATYLGDGVVNGPAHPNYGKFPSDFEWAAEDSLTGNAGSPLHANSIMIPGPLPSQVAATHSARWTRPGGTANAYLMHEGVHALNFDSGFLSAYLHMFASGAEVVAGVSTDAPRYDVDYHFSLSPTAGNDGNAYPHWQSFIAYLAFNWRGTDTSPGGWQDDLLRRWAKQPATERDLLGLAKRLRDAECQECVNYPGFAGLDSLARVQRLIHDWRIANYVNSSALLGGKYGYPPEFGFSPCIQLGAWQNIDGVAADDSVSIPPVVTLGPSPAARSQWFTKRPAGNGFGPSLLDMQMFGAEYFVFRADPALSANPQKLVVRVRPSMLLKQVVNAGANCTPIVVRNETGRVHASIVTYSQAPDSLFRHPEWATSVVTKSALLDSVRGDLEFEVQGFGGTTQAVVLVVSLGDGPSGLYSATAAYLDAPSMKWELGAVLDDGTIPLSPRAIGSSALGESDGAWSPDGTRLAYRQEEQGGASRIYVRNADGSGFASPLRSPSAGQAEPAWSPRGDRIAYAEGDTLATIRFVDVSTGSVQGGVDMVGHLHEPAYAPDGGRLAYLRHWISVQGDTIPEPPPHEDGLGEQLQEGSHIREVRVRNLASGADSLLAQFVEAPLDMAAPLRGLRWSSNFRFLTFSRLVPTTGMYHLYQLDMRTRALTTHDTQAPAARTREVSPGSGPLLLEEAAGRPYVLHCNPNAWVCLCHSAPTSEIVAIAPADWISLRDTSAATSMPMGFRTGAVFSQPRWSPDGTRVAYTTTQNGNPDVYVIAATLDRAPVMWNSVIAEHSFTNCGGFNLMLGASDPDGDPLTYRALGLPVGATFANGNQVVWPAPVVGDHWFVTQALDPTGAVATRLIHLNVYDGGDCGEGGGGGGEGEILPGGGHSARVAGPNRLLRPGAGGPRAVNSLLDGAAPGEWAEQTARLVVARTDEFGHISAGLVGLRPGKFRLDRARLLVVDHDPALLAVATDDGIVLGSKRAPSSVEASGGSGTAAGLVRAGTILSVNWAEGDQVDGLALDCARSGAVDTLQDWGVHVEVRDGEDWRPAGRLMPRSGYDMLAVSLQGSSEARLRFGSDVYVREVAGYSVAGAQGASVARLSCESASLDGAVTDLAETDGSAVTLERGEGLALSFAGPAAAEGMRRTLFLELVASFTPAGAQAGQSQLVGSQPTGRFALLPSLPNPFERTTAIRLEVPRASEVRVEVFDALGRRVRTLANQVFPPGVHSLEWDGSDARGVRMGPGVYVVRMMSDGFRQEQRVVWLGN
jgi:hypothetical protein